MKKRVRSKAIAGALARMSRNSNRLCRHFSSSPTDFGDWDDWDNGHSDGPTD